MHKTLYDNVKGFIDNLYVKDNSLRISGWLVNLSQLEPTFKLKNSSGLDIVFYSNNERQDVANFYKTEKERFLNCGFDLTIPTPKTKDLQIYFVASNGEETIEEKIFDLNVDLNNKVVVPSQNINETVNIKIRQKIVPELVVVDNFYSNPLDVRKLALEQNFEPDLRYHKGNRTQKRFLPQGMKQVFESLLGSKISKWVEHGYNGVFQFCTAEDPIVYHSDMQSYAAVVYLTPDAPCNTGTSFYKSKRTGDRKSYARTEKHGEIYKGGFYDGTQFELVDTVGNIFNRLVIWDSRMIHSATTYFGTEKSDSRLFHIFFFDIEE